MAHKETRLIRRGVPRKEYLDYFLTLGEQAEPGRFIGVNWEVVVGEEREGKILTTCCIVEAEIIFRGEEDVIKAMIDAFRLKFLRAGG